MKELNEFFATVVEAKKVAKENDIGGKLVEEASKRIKSSNPFAKRSAEAPLVEVAPVVPVEITLPVAEESVEVLTPELNEILSAPVSPVNPKPVPVDSMPELKAISDKLKYMEQWVGRIANTGPGSGEVNFRYLDDVNRATMLPSNDNWLLEYDAATKKVQFTEEIGAIRTVLFNQEGPFEPLTPGQLAWNPNEDCLDVRQSDGSTLQVGLENYIQVRNNSGATLTQGTVVRFSGVYSNGDFVPTVVPHIADGSIPPLYTVGVVTVDIPNSQVGRATLLGKVRDIDTTGTSSGETWVPGDILYVHPTLAGKLTKNKPTAPQVVISVAAVLKVGTTDGILLVRPVIFPRLHYGTFVDKTSQTHTLINTPKAMTFNTTEIANGHRRGTDTSRIIAENSGLYNYKFSVQLVSTNSAAKEVWIWFRKNGVDIPDSSTRKTIVGNSVYDVAAWDITLSMQPNDYFQIMWAVSDIAVSVTAPPATAFCPAIPSVILNVTEAAL